MDRIVIRPANLGDIPEISKVHIDTWRTAYRGLVPDEYLAGLTYEQREQRWREIESRSPGLPGMFVAVDSTALEWLDLQRAVRAMRLNVIAMEIWRQSTSRIHSSGKVWVND